MIQSLVDYVLERGRIDYGEFAPKDSLDPSTALYNHRKLLAYLFQEEGSSEKFSEQKLARRISDLKIEQISGQLNYFSQKIHAQLSKKYLNLDSDLYKVQNQWLRKKIPDFYCYYFLKFTYANSYSRMHQIVLSQIENMSKDRDSYVVIKKTIEARQSCLSNLRRMASTIKQLEIEESLQTIQQERDLKRKLKVARQHSDFKSKEKEEGKSWKNQLEVLFENINHLRKLTNYVVELIRVWRMSIYNLSDDPRRYRERVIFYFNDANYLLKMLFDSNFLKETILKKYLPFSKGFDPFCLKPAMLLQNKRNRNETQDIFFELIRPTESDMDKMTKSLVILAQQEYDEDQQSRFINQRKNYGELQQRKQFIQRRRDGLGLKKNQSEKVLPQKNNLRTTQNLKDSLPASVVNKQVVKQGKKMDFSADKRSYQTQKQIEKIKSERDDIKKNHRVQTSLNRLKQMKATDLKKVSPYLSRNEMIDKAQKVIELQHKFRVAQEQYVTSLKQKQQSSKQKVKIPVEAGKQGISSRIFNKYIQENLKMIEQANKKSYIYKNPTTVSRTRIASSLNYNQVPFTDRKEIQYERNLEKYYPKEQQSPSPRKRGQQKVKGTRAVIEISNKGVRANQKIIQFQLSNKKGLNVGSILNKRQKSISKDSTNKKLSPGGQKQQEQQGDPKQLNLFETEKQPQVLIIRQQPEKIEQIKQFLYTKIKEQLLEQMKKNAQSQQIQINNMIEQEKRKKLQEIIEQRRLQEERRRQEQEKARLARLDRERKKLSFDIRVQPIQYAEQNVDTYFQEVFSIQGSTFNRLFTTQKIQVLKQQIKQQFYYIFLKGYFDGKDEGVCILHFNWQYDLHRKMIIDYISLKSPYLCISYLHRVLEYMWNNDPVQEIEMVLFQNLQNGEGMKVLEDVESYTKQSGQIFEKQLYSNITEYRFVWMRPTHYSQIQFPFKNYHFGKRLSFKAELLSASLSLSERHAPQIEMTLQIFTNYAFLIEQLFRKYLTPQEVVELRQNSNNIRRLKDIFRIVLQLEKNQPVVDQLVVVQGLNLDDLYNKLKDKKMGPYDRYYWHHFYDRVAANRLLLSVLEMRPQLKFGVQSCKIDDRKFLRINCRQKVLVLRSSIYSQNSIFILDTHNPKIKMFFVNGQDYKLMRMELFVFLNLLFNNIIEDNQRFINSIWVPQFTICDGQSGKSVKRITDFSISMKKSFFLSEQIYFANNQYIKNAVSLLPRQADVIMRQSIVFGFLHSEVEQASTGMPLYAKLIDKSEMFK